MRSESKSEQPPQWVVSVEIHLVSCLSLAIEPITDLLLSLLLGVFVEPFRGFLVSDETCPIAECFRTGSESLLCKFHLLDQIHHLFGDPCC